MVTAFIGPSGCGKSTLLRVPEPDLRPLPGPAGDRRGAAGRREHPVDQRQDLNLLRGRDRHGVPEADAVPDVDLRQHRLRHPPLRAPAQGGDGRTGSRRRCAAPRSGTRSRTSCDQSGLGLSGGQQQRLCIARAIAVQPEVILIDEPCSALDPISTAKVEELIDELKADYTIVIVTHNMQQAARVSRLHRLHVPGRAGRVRRDRADLHQPAAAPTQDYITGRFG